MKEQHIPTGLLDFARWTISKMRLNGLNHATNLIWRLVVKEYWQYLINHEEYKRLLF